jgi:hypothetical protein
MGYPGNGNRKKSKCAGLLYCTFATVLKVNERCFTELWHGNEINS